MIIANTLPVLNAAHIKSVQEKNLINRNGPLLREDLHTLFHRGYMTITTDYHVEVSSEIKKITAIVGNITHYIESNCWYYRIILRQAVEGVY